MAEEIPEWSKADDGSWLHRTTIVNRIEELGWPKKEAMEKPVRENIRNNKPSVASRAREDGFKPGEIQSTIRVYGVPYEDAANHLESEGKKRSSTKANKENKDGA